MGGVAAEEVSSLSRTATTIAAAAAAAAVTTAVATAARAPAWSGGVAPQRAREVRTSSCDISCGNKSTLTRNSLCRVVAG